MARTLTPTMESHLWELLDAPHWRPETQGEWSCARAMEERGLLHRHVRRGERPYELTERGRRLGRLLKARSYLVTEAMCMEPEGQHLLAGTLLDSVDSLDQVLKVIKKAL